MGLLSSPRIVYLTLLSVIIVDVTWQLPQGDANDGVITPVPAQQRLLELGMNPNKLLQWASYQAYPTQEDIYSFLSTMKSMHVDDKDLCYSQIIRVMEDLVQNKAPYAEQMLDSFGKPPSGLLSGAFNWYGSYAECINASLTESYVEIHGKYCLASIPLPVNGTPIQIALRTGICIPESCSAQALMKLIDYVGDILPVNVTISGCQPRQPPEPDAAAIGVISTFAVIFITICVATLLDVYLSQSEAHRSSDLDKQASPTGRMPGIICQSEGPISEVHDGPHVPRTPEMRTTLDVSDYAPLVSSSVSRTRDAKCRGKPIRFLLAFSLRTNGAKLLSTKTTKGVLGCLHGIRFFSITWVILGHTYILSIPYVNNLLEFVDNLRDRISISPILSAALSVDSFFLLSGTLSSYVLLGQLSKKGGPRQINWALYYFHRFWRLSPPYFLLLGFLVAVLPYMGQGPMWPHKQVAPYCSGTWWSNLLYVNNLVYGDKMCFNWSWYLAVDMQFFLLSPVFILPLYRFGGKGFVVPLLGIAGSCVTTGIITFRNNYPADFAMSVVDFADIDSLVENVYMVPWCRFGPYGIGVILGYLLLKHTEEPYHLKKVVVAVGWVVAAGCCFSVVYGLTLSGVPQGHHLSPQVNAFYAAMFRSVWASGLAWLIFACVTGYGGWLNRFLSWSPLMVLSRLTYMAYLVHPMIMYWYWGSLQAPLYSTDFTQVWSFFAFLVATFGVALATSLMLESPMLALEKVLLY